MNNLFSRSVNTNQRQLCKKNMYYPTESICTKFGAVNQFFHIFFFFFKRKVYYYCIGIL